MFLSDQINVPHAFEIALMPHMHHNQPQYDPRFCQVLMKFCENAPGGIIHFCNSASIDYEPARRALHSLAAVPAYGR
jgi:hypothetical protein